MPKMQRCFQKLQDKEGFRNDLSRSHFRPYLCSELGVYRTFHK